MRLPEIIGAIVFQSTPPARGATAGSPSKHPHDAHFNPRPPRGGRRQGGAAAPPHRVISIHAPREGGDLAGSGDRAGHDGFQSTPPARGATEALASVDLKGEFQSTPPARGATNQAAIGHHVFAISIHAPREGGDENRRHPRPAGDHFNPRPPRGGRRCVMYPSASS